MLEDPHDAHGAFIEMVGGLGVFPLAVYLARILLCASREPLGDLRVSPSASSA